MTVAAISVALLTQGPVISLWSRGASTWDEFAIPTAITATYFAVYGTSAFLLGRAPSALRSLDNPRSRLLVTLCLLIAASTIWSTARSVTMSSAAGFVGVALTGVWFQLRLDVRQQAVAVSVGTQIGLHASTIAIVRGWAGATDVDGDWTGIYYNRNSLAPVAAAALLSSTYVLAFARRAIANRARRVAFVVLVIAADLVAIALLRGSRSLTSWFALAAAGGVVALLHGARRLGLRSRHLSAGLIGLGALSLTGVIVLRGPLSNQAERNPGYSSRFDIWRIVWGGIRERPVGGWGFNAAWWDPSFRVPLELNGWFSKVTTAHNGFLEVVLGAGVAAGVTLAALVVLTLIAATDQSFTTSDGSWRLAILVFCLVLNIQESFVVGHHFVWMLLVACIVSPPAAASLSRPRAGVTLPG